MKYVIPFLFCLGVIQGSYAQEVLENNPPSLKWYQIKSPHFKVIYPAGFEQQAQRVTNTLEHIYEPEAKSLGVRPRKISVVLQNQSSISNGFVTMIPRRSEFYTMPPQDYNFGGTNDWLDQLATHEYRHIVQFQRAITGFNKALYYLFGPATLTAMSITAVPQWFWEGDAVATETAFTHSGRGRIPNFGLLMRTNLQEGRVFNYHKQYLRSYKHNIPDHYVLGYYMVGYLRKRTNDPEIWEKITRRAWNVPFIPFTFSNAIKKESGLYVTQLYKEMAADLTKSFTDELNNVQFTPFQKVNSREVKAYTNYSNPQVLPDGSIVAMKSGIADISQLVTLNDGKEKHAFTPGFINDAGMLSAAGSTVVWNEFGFDARWRVKNYSLIKAYDVSTNRYWTITTKSRYSGAALSPDATKVVTVESATDYSVALVVISSEDGSVMKKFSNPDNAFYSMARWSTDGKKIVSLKTKDYQRSIVAIDYESGKEETLVEPTRENRGHPVLHGNFLFYNSPVTGIDNIYVFDIEKQQHLQVTSSKYGSYNPVISADGKTIYYNEQLKDGLDVVSTPLDPASWKTFSPATVKHYDDYLTEQEGRPTLFDSIPSTEYVTKKYTSQLMPYSWGAYLNTTFTQADIGISAQDILSTTVVNVGYLFDPYERTGSWKARVSYQGFYPIIDAQVLFGNRQDKFTAFGNDITFKWNETAFESGLRIPWLITRSRFSTGFEIGNYVGVTKISDFNNTIANDGVEIYNGPDRAVTFTSNNVDYLYLFRDQLTTGELRYNKAYLSFYNLLKRSPRDFNSKWGQFIQMDYYSTPFAGDFTGALFAFRSGWYFPGVAKHHSLNFRFDYQSRALGVERNLYTFRNSIFKPRGFGYPLDQKFTAFAANYELPLWYPDISVGPLLNIQRVKTNLFYDYGKGTGLVYVYGVDPPSIAAFNNDNIYKSTGVELTFDINIMRFLPKFEIGFRYTYMYPTRFTGAATSFEFLIGNIGF
jgi:hypothetical protein